MAAGYSEQVTAGSVTCVGARQGHVQPDRGAGLVRMHFDLVTDLVDDPEPVPAQGVQGRLAAPRQRIGDDALVVDLADYFLRVVPDLQAAR